MEKNGKATELIGSDSEYFSRMVVDTANATIDESKEIRDIKERSQKIEIELGKIMTALTLKNDEAKESKFTCDRLVLILICINIFILDLSLFRGKHSELQLLGGQF